MEESEGEHSVFCSRVISKSRRSNRPQYQSVWSLGPGINKGEGVGGTKKEEEKKGGGGGAGRGGGGYNMGWGEVNFDPYKTKKNGWWGAISFSHGGGRGGGGGGDTRF